LREDQIYVIFSENVKATLVAGTGNPRC